MTYEHAVIKNYHEALSRVDAFEGEPVVAFIWSNATDTMLAWALGVLVIDYVSPSEVSFFVGHTVLCLNHEAVRSIKLGDGSVEFDCGDTRLVIDDDAAEAWLRERSYGDEVRRSSHRLRSAEDGDRRVA